jgi:hypothetical protein
MRVAAEPLAKAAKRLSRWASGPLTTPVAVLEAQDGQLSLRVKGPAGWFVEQVPALEPEPEVEAEAQGPEPPWGLTADPAKLESILSGIRRRQELELQLVEAVSAWRSRAKPCTCSIRTAAWGRWRRPGNCRN